MSLLETVFTFLAKQNWFSVPTGGGGGEGSEKFRKRELGIFGMLECQRGPQNQRQMAGLAGTSALDPEGAALVGKMHPSLETLLASLGRRRHLRRPLLSLCVNSRIRLFIPSKLMSIICKNVKANRPGPRTGVRETWAPALVLPPATGGLNLSSDCANSFYTFAVRQAVPGSGDTAVDKQVSAPATWSSHGTGGWAQELVQTFPTLSSFPS